MVAKTARQASIFAVSKFAARIFSFFAFLYIARRIGPDNFGVYIYLTSVAGILIALSSLGIIGEVLRKGKELGRGAIENSFFIYFLSNLLGSMVVFTIVVLRGYTFILAILTGLILISRSIYDFMNIFHFIKGRIRYVTLATLGDRLIFTLLVFILPPKTSSLILAGIFSLIVMNVFLYSKIGFKIKTKLDFTYLSLPFFLNGIFLSIGEKIPIVIYDAKFSIGELGIFGAALALFSAGAMIINEIFRYLQVRSGFMTDLGKMKFRNLTVLGAIASLAGFMILKPLLELFANLIYGSTYLGVGGLFFTFSLAIPAMILEFYPRIKVFYHSPWLYAIGSLVFAVASSVGALLASNIEFGAVFYSLSHWVYALTWWTIFSLIKTRIQKPST